MLNCRHVLEECEAIEATRRKEGIRNFLDSCREAGLASETSYRYYISGLDANGLPIPVQDHLSRGGSLSRLTQTWLDIWDPSE